MTQTPAMDPTIRTSVGTEIGIDTRTLDRQDDGTLGGPHLAAPTRTRRLGMGRGRPAFRGRPFLSGQGHMAPEGSHGVALTGGEQVADLLE
jgi:hypothetical protein